MKIPFARLVLLPLLSLTIAACQQAAPADAAEGDVTAQPLLIDGFDPNIPADEYRQLCDRVLADAREAFGAIEAQTGPATLETVMGAYEAITYDLQAVRQSWHLKAVHPDADIRDAATSCTEQYNDFTTQVGLSRAYYDRLAAIPGESLSRKEAYMLNQTLRTFRRAGVDKDPETRERIRSLQKAIVELGNAFDRNIRDDVRYVTTTVSALAGLPQDYLDGNVRISTNSPDLYPVMTYAHDDALRAALRKASRSRGYPANDAILEEIIEKRHELARLLGFDSFAALSMDDKMIGTPGRAQAFLDDISNALRAPVEVELARLLTRLRQIDADAEEVQAWQAAYLTNLIRQEDYAVDNREVRQYFRYGKVRDGIFRLTEDLFGVTIRPWDTATWHEDVETWEILEDGVLLGRFYMDNHPRENKYKHAAHWTIRSGIKNRQIPLSGLAQNFPRGLMEHSQVETFLHEFGHLLHNVFSGNQEWFAITGMTMERDFVEAPSQMLEEWIWDYDTLATFASNDAGEVIPRALVEKMSRARYLGLATSTATQIFYAKLSLNYHNRDPESFELKPLMLELQSRHSPYPYMPGTTFYANFGHLYNYSSNYYMYQWSLAIATDLFSRFREEGMRNEALARAYRERVLGAAGSKPADAFVEDFLGRPFSPSAYIEKLRTL